MTYKQNQDDQNQPLFQTLPEQPSTVVQGTSINVSLDDISVREKRAEAVLKQKNKGTKHKRKIDSYEKLDVNGSDSDYDDFSFSDASLLPLPSCSKELKDIIILSPFNQHKVPNQRWQAIANQFNGSSRASYMTEAACCGKRVKPNEVLLMHVNYKPQLVLPTSNIMRRLYEFWFCCSCSGVSDYVGKFKQSEPLIGKYGKYILTVPPGQYAKALGGAEKKPKIYGPGIHVISDPNFIFNSKGDKRTGLVNQSELHIGHDPIHILRVPKEKIAKVTIDSTPYLLQGRDEPYVFESATFKLPSNKFDEIFKDTTDQLIIHGSLKKITPFPGEVGIAYNNGRLVIIEEPLLVDNEKFKFDEFLQINIQKYVFPSQEAQETMKKEGNKNYMFEQFRTRDGLEVGVKLLVLIKIKEPKLLVKRLRGTDVKRFVEDIVVTAMGNVIQHHSSIEFQKPSQSTASSDISKGEKMDEHDLQGTVIEIESTEKFFTSLQGEVTAKLSVEFKKIGIRLKRMNIETAKVLDEKIAHEISEFAVTTTKMATTVALLDQQTETKQVEAEQKEMQLKIGVRAKANAKIAETEGDLKAMHIELKKMHIELEKMEIEAKFYKDNPHMLELKKRELGTEAVKNIKNANLTPGQFADLVYGRFFNNQAQNPGSTQNLLEVSDSQQEQSQGPVPGSGNSQ